MSDRAKLGIVVGILLALVPAWNFLAGGAASVFHAKQKHKEPEAESVPKIQLPVKEGPENAPVVITAYLSGNNPCHMTSISMLQQLAREYPGQVRVEVYDKNDPEVAKEAERVKIGCEMGILINGRGAFNIPGRGIVMLQGPVDTGHDYTIDDLRLIVEKTIREKTGKPPKRNPAATVHGDHSACAHGASSPSSPDDQPFTRNEGKPSFKTTVGPTSTSPPGP